MPITNMISHFNFIPEINKGDQPKIPRVIEKSEKSPLPGEARPPTGKRPRRQF